MRCFLNVASLLQSRISIGNEFQADGAETAKALSVNRRRVRGVMKSLLDLERSRLSVHGLRISTTAQFHEKLCVLKHTVFDVSANLVHLGCITLASIHRVSLDTTSKAVAKVFHRDARVMQLNTSYHSRHATKHMVQCWNNAFFKLSCHLFCLCCHFSILDFEKFSSRMPEKKLRLVSIYLLTSLT